MPLKKIAFIFFDVKGVRYKEQLKKKSYRIDLITLLSN